MCLCVCTGKTEVGLDIGGPGCPSQPYVMVCTGSVVGLKFWGLPCPAGEKSRMKMSSVYVMDVANSVSAWCVHLPPRS